MKNVRVKGDSTVLGSTTNGPGMPWHQATMNTPATMNEIFKAKLGEGSVNVFNDGKSGSTIVDWFAGSAALGMPSMAVRMATPEYQAMDIGVLEIGINDMQAGTPVEAFKWYLQQINELYVANNKKLVLCTPNPVNDPRWTQLYALQRATQDFANWFRIPLINYYDAINHSMPNWRDMLCDNAHPTETMYAFKGALAASVLEQYVK